MSLHKLRFAIVEEIVAIATTDMRPELHLGLSKLLERVGLTHEVPLPIDSRLHSIMHVVAAEATARLTPRRSVMFDEMSRERIVLNNHNQSIVLSIPPTTFYVLPAL